MNELVYNINDKPPFAKNFLLALQQVFSIIVGTMVLPMIVDPSGQYLSQSSALIGAGVGTIVYLLLTKFKSPVCLGSSFSYILPLLTAVNYGYFGVFLGSVFSGIVYVILAVIIKFVGVNWMNKIMPPLVIGPVVALIGLNLASDAVTNIMNTSVSIENYSFISIIIGLITFFVTIIISTKGGKKLRMYPFLIGIFAGYVLCSIVTGIGFAVNVDALKLIDFSEFSKVADFSNWIPNFTFVGLFKEGTSKITSFGDIITIFVAFVPISFVSFAEHIADHKNLGSIIDKDLLKEPGLTRTLLGDGLGSIAGAFAGGCPNTTYGESIGCVALSKNASTKTILFAAIICIVIAFFYPLVVFVTTIPTCVIGGICIALYGFISVSGLRMIKDFNLNESQNLFVVAAIFITGIGGLVLKFGSVEISNIAVALIVGIITNLLLNTTKRGKKISANSALLEDDKTVRSNKQNGNEIFNSINQKDFVEDINKDTENDNNFKDDS